MNSKGEELKCVKKQKICLNLKAVKLVEEAMAMFTKQREKICKLENYLQCLSGEILRFLEFEFQE